MPVLYVVACGGRPAADLPPFVTRLLADGWHVCVIATPSAVKFIDIDALAAVTGHPVRYEYKQPDEPDVLPPPDAYVIAPATFNTINKMVSGASDTLALGLLNEAIGLRLPIIAVPTPNKGLTAHPAFAASVQTLRSWGVNVMFDPDRRLPSASPEVSAAASFPVYAVGRKSGKRYAVPVAYTRHDGVLLIGTSFRWARNLRTGEPVEVRYLGRRRTADVEVRTEEAAVVADYAVIARDNHQFARFNTITLDPQGNPAEADLHRAWRAGARVLRLTVR